jgi:hypothetical protein
MEPCREPEASMAANLIRDAKYKGGKKKAA